MHKLAIVATLVLLTFIFWILYMANTGREAVFFTLVQAIPYGDKIGHALLYGSLALLANAALRFRAWGIGYARVYAGTALVSVFVVTEELTQVLFATRTLDAVDILADIVGLAAASAASYCLAVHKPKRNSRS